jgi:hypothetical protein
MTRSGCSNAWQGAVHAAKPVVFPYDMTVSASEMASMHREVVPDVDAVPIVATFEFLPGCWTIGSVAVIWGTRVPRPIKTSFLINSYYIILYGVPQP